MQPARAAAAVSGYINVCPILQAEAIQKGLAFHLISSLVLWQNNC